MAYFRLSRTPAFSHPALFSAVFFLCTQAYAAPGQDKSESIPASQTRSSSVIGANGNSVPVKAAAPVDSRSAAGSEQASAEGPSSLAEGEESERISAPDLSATTETLLDNDLRIVLQATPGAPRVSVCTGIAAGSKHDPEAAPGAHRVLGEMLRDGGYRSSSQDYVALVQSRGGASEVFVGRESTVFCTTVPAGELPLALWVSAGRFTAGALTESALKEVVDRLAHEAEQKDAEIRTGRAPARLRKMAFLGSYEFAHPTLPNPDDLDSLTLKGIRALHRREYVARRSVVVISGGFEEAVAKSQFASHLYAARPGEVAEKGSVSLVSQNTGRFSMAEDRSAKTPAAWYGWVAPQGEDRQAMEVALSVLTSESRLGRSLVGPGRAAKSMELHLDDRMSTHSLSRIEIIGSNSRSLGTIEKAFDSQLRQLSRVAPSPSEIRKVQEAEQQLKSAGLQTSRDRAQAVAHGVIIGQSPNQVLEPLAPDASLNEMSPERVRLAAAQLLAPTRRSAIEIYPKGWQDPWQVPMRQYHIVEKGQTLGSIAVRYGTSVAVITKMNGTKRSKRIYPGDKLRVPRGKKKAAKKARSHQVRRGDTLSGLALKYGVSVRQIADANGMGSKLTIRSGESLRIPWGRGKTSSKGSSSSSASSSPAVVATYRVKSGDTLSGIAAKKGVSTVALARANGISHKAGVRVGQTLKLPAPGTGKKRASQTTRAPKIYQVKKGDTLSGIAKKHGVTVKALTVENGISRKSTLRLGQSLKIPTEK